NATIALSRITGGTGSVQTIGVRAVGSQASLTANCQTFDAQGRCTASPAASNRGILGRLTAGTGESYAVVLDNSPFSIVDTSALSANSSDIGASIRIKGNGFGVRVRANRIGAYGGVQHSH